MRIKPFHALRPDSRAVDQVASKALANLTNDEAMTIINDNNKSFLRIKQSESDQVINEFLDEGWLIKEQKASYYIYRLIDEEKDESYFGIVGAVSAKEISRGQKEDSKKTEKMKQLVETIQAYPVLPILTYPEHSHIADCITEARAKKLPIASFDEEDGTNHCIWRVNDEESIERITQCFEVDDNPFTVAKGHDLLAAAEAFPTADGYIPVMIFSEETDIFKNVLDGLFLYDI